MSTEIYSNDGVQVVRYAGPNETCMVRLSLDSDIQTVLMPYDTFVDMCRTCMELEAGEEIAEVRGQTTADSWGETQKLASELKIRLAQFKAEERCIKRRANVLEELCCEQLDDLDDRDDGAIGVSERMQVADMRDEVFTMLDLVNALKEAISR